MTVPVSICQQYHVTCSHVKGRKPRRERRICPSWPWSALACKLTYTNRIVAWTGCMWSGQGQVAGFFEHDYEIVEEWKTNLMSLAILFHLLYAQHVSDINISIFRNLRLCWWVTTSVVLFSVRCVLELLLRLVFGGVRWGHNKWNKTASDIKLVFHSSTIAMMHGPIDIRFTIMKLQRP